MTDEKEIINPREEGSNVTSGSRHKEKEKEIINEINQLIDSENLNHQFPNFIVKNKADIKKREFYCDECGKWKEKGGIFGFFAGLPSCYEYNGKKYCDDCWNGKWHANDQCFEGAIKDRVIEQERIFALSKANEIIKSNKGLFEKREIEIKQAIKALMAQWDELKTKLEKENQELKNQLNRAEAKATRLTTTLKEKEDEFLEKIDKLEKESKAHDEQNIEQNRKLWGKEGVITEFRKKLVDSRKREVSRIIRTLEIETEETDELTRTYQQLYWAREKCNPREIENKEKKVGEIKKELIKKVDNDILEEKIFETCKEIAELNFQSEQSQHEITQLLETKIEALAKS
jgi:hypothetical protein